MQFGKIIAVQINVYLKKKNLWDFIFQICIPCGICSSNSRGLLVGQEALRHRKKEREEN